MAGLTMKQKAFVAEILVDLNATQAALRAGYSAKNAMHIGYQLLQKTLVQEAIQKAQVNREKRTEITQDRVLAELAKLGFSDMRQFTAWGPGGVGLKSSDELTDEEAACVAEVSETVTQAGGTVRFKLHDKKGALELLARHLGMLNDKLAIIGEVQYEIKKPEGL